MAHADAAVDAGRARTVVRMYFALGMMSVGVLALVYGYGVLVAQPLPAWFPSPNRIAHACGILMLATGAGLLFERSARIAIRILAPFLLLWTLTRVPIPIMDPFREITWFLVGEIAVLLAAALVLYARYVVPGMSGRAVPLARILVGLSVVTYGLSHFFEFAARTISLVPPWLPFPRFWADLMGAAQVAAGLGVLLAIYPRVCATAEAALLTVFALLVWVPAVVTKPHVESNWVEFLFTAALAGAIAVVAESIPARAVSMPARSDT